MASLSDELAAALDYLSARCGGERAVPLFISSREARQERIANLSERAHVGGDPSRFSIHSTQW
jgi:hypothetical protein